MGKTVIRFAQCDRKGDGKTGCFPAVEILKPQGFKERSAFGGERRRRAR